MSIASNLGMAWITSDLSSTGAIGGMQNMASAVSGNPEDSVFQNLITQMLMQKNQSDSNNDILSGLLVGRNSSKGKLQNLITELGESSETVIDAGAAGAAGATDESSVSLEMIQALMFGMTNASQFINNEKIDPEIQNSKNPFNSTISEVLSAGSELRILGNQRWILNNNQEDSTADLLTDSKMEPYDTAISDSIAKSASFDGTDVIEQRNPEQIIADKQDLIAQAGFKISEIGNKNQTVILDSESVEGVAGSVDKIKQETESIQQIGLEKQSPLQSIGSVNETPELTPLAQTVEKVQPYTQISNEILTKLEQKGPTEFKMQLDPEDLGQIDIKLKINDGKLMIDILAANSKTQELLTGQVDKLISSMGLQNVKVESVQVNQQMNSQSQDSQSQSQGYAMNFGMDFSQRKQQEHFRQEVFKGGRLAGVTNSQQNETQAVELTTGIGPLRYDPHRMNYAV